jgi:hypothetical protein
MDAETVLIEFPHYRHLALAVIKGAVIEWRHGDYRAGLWMRETGVYWLELCGFDVDPDCLEKVLGIF